MQNSPLDKPADLRTLHQLHVNGLLTDDAYQAACRVIRSSLRWHAWVVLNLLLIGTTLVLAGIIFFFAYNWSALDRYVKFALIEASIIVCIVGAFLRGFHSIIGKAFLLAASILVGVWLAVYGQVYQTGADAYELFRGWVILIAGWVFISDFAALWIVWVVLLNITGIQYWVGYLNPVHGVVEGEWIWMVLAALNGTALILREIGLRWNRNWLSGNWLRIFLIILLLLVISVPVIFTILDVETIHFGLETVLIWSVVVVAGYLCFRRFIPDRSVIAAIVIDVSAIALIWIGKLLFNDLTFRSSGIYLLYFGMIVLVVTGAGYFLRVVSAKIDQENKDRNHEP